jgi:hypothetical protein
MKAKTWSWFRSAISTQPNFSCCRIESPLEGGAAEQRDGADEARETAELRSLSLACSADATASWKGAVTKFGSAVSARTRRQLLAGVVVVCDGVRRHAPGPWVPKATFTDGRDIVVRRIRVELFVGVHVVPPARGHPAFRAIVGVRAASRQRRNWGKPGWHPTLRRVGWYSAAERLLRQYGYRGTWLPSPWGPFGHFERSFRTAAALLAELESLERLKAEPWEALTT